MTAFGIQATGPGHLVASGAMNFDTASEALAAGLALIPRGQPCTIDLAQVTETDSAGLAVLVEWLATARRRETTIRYEGVPAQILAVARLSDLDDLLLQGNGAN